MERQYTPADMDAFVPGLRYRSGAHELWALIVEMLSEWERRSEEASGASGLSPVAAWALIQIDPEHPISQKELAGRLHCNPSTVVDPTDRLEHCGLVERKAKAGDRRINVLVITERGRAVRDELIRRLFEPPEALRTLPPEDARRFRDAMRGAVGRA
ncbi:MAG TPA: MarR family winged helix-turn-helix transcriptional regulator [Candidatus Dormibacteraeota bacterium]